MSVLFQLLANTNSDSDDEIERLPKVSYAVLKDKALKDLLVSQRLPTNGDRNTWILRHRRYVHSHTQVVIQILSQMGDDEQCKS